MVTKLIHDESSHPVIGRTVKTVMTLEASQKKLECKINALIKYNRAVMAATKKLEAELKKCK